MSEIQNGPVELCLRRESNILGRNQDIGGDGLQADGQTFAKALWVLKV